MKVAVLAKEVPDLEALVKVTDGGKALDIEKKRVLNFFDEIAVEAAVKLKEAGQATTYVVTATAGQGLEAARRSLAMGVEQAFLVDDPALESADPATVARALAALLTREGYDLILAGRQATDDEAGLVGPMVAELLGLPCVVGIVGLELEDGTALATVETDLGKEKLAVPLPAVLTTEKGLYEPRVPSMMGLMKAMKAQVPKVTLAELGVAAASSPVAEEYWTKGARPPVRIVEGETPAEIAGKLVKLLREEAKAL